MSLTATVQLNMTPRDALTDIDGVPTNTVITYNGFNTSASLSSTSTPPVTKKGVFKQALTAGAATIDLTAIPDDIVTTVDGSGLKVVGLKVKSPSTNDNIVLLSKGASNGYQLNGEDWNLALKPGEEVCLLYANAATMPEIDATHKTILLGDDSAGGTDEFEIVILLG